MPDPGRYGPPPVPPPEPGPTPGPSPSPTPVPRPVPAPPPCPGPWLSASARACCNTPTRSRLSAGAVTIGATTTGNASADNVGGFGSGGFSIGFSGLGGSRLGTGLLIFLVPSRNAFGAGAFWRSPPPPPPPPGPGVFRNTSLIGSDGASIVLIIVTTGEGPNVKTNTATAKTPACSVLDTANGRRDRWPVTLSKIEKMPGLLSCCSATRRRPRATASRCETKSTRPRTARTRASGTPAARAISRAEYMPERQWQKPCREWLSGISRFGRVSGRFLDQLPSGCARGKTAVWPNEDFVRGAYGGLRIRGQGQGPRITG